MFWWESKIGLVPFLRKNERIRWRHHFLYSHPSSSSSCYFNTFLASVSQISHFLGIRTGKICFFPGKTVFESSYWDCFQTNNNLKAAVGLLLNWFPTFSQAHKPNVATTQAAWHYSAILNMISLDKMQWYWHL